MKKFLFLLILILATCVSVLLSVNALRSERAVGIVRTVKSPMVWIYSGYELVKPVLFRKR